MVHYPYCTSKILVCSTPPQRSEGGHPLPAGHPLT
jgi:hypothetical protein